MFTVKVQKSAEDQVSIKDDKPTNKIIQNENNKSNSNDIPVNEAVKEEDTGLNKEDDKQSKKEAIKKLDVDLPDTENNESSRSEKSKIIKEFKKLQADPVKDIPEKEQSQKEVN